MKIQKYQNPAGKIGEGVKIISKAVKKPISVAERLGIPKSIRSNPKALEDVYYWGYPQWNQRYNAAIESGNWKEAQRLRDLHFKVKAFNNQFVNENDVPLTLYHGNLASDSKMRSIGLNPYSTYRNSRQSSGYFAVVDPTIAKTYTYMPDSKIYSLYGYSKNPMNINANGHSWANVDNFSSTDAIVNKAFNQGHDAVKIDNVVDYGINTPVNHPRTPFTDYVFIPGHVKLKDAIIRDGLFDEIIPIVKRDNFHNPDIRYKKGGILKAQNGSSTDFKKWYESVPKEYNDTTTYNLREAYYNLPFTQLENWRTNPELNHLPSGYEDKDGNFHLLKSIQHPSILSEYMWLNSPDGTKYMKNFYPKGTWPYNTYDKIRVPYK